MKYSVDFSIFTQEPAAFGNVVGLIHLVVEPVVGDVIWFLRPANGAKMPSCGFGGSLIVEGRSLVANSEDGGVSLGLSDLTVVDANDARAIAKYFENGFGFFSNEYLDC